MTDFTPLVTFGAVAVQFTMCLLAVLSVLLIPFGIPGNWLIALCFLPGVWMEWGWTPFLIQLGLATLAEILEFSSGLKHARKGGATRAGSWGGILGSVVGAIFLTGLIPIPVVGTLLGAALGAFAGAFFVEIGYARRTGSEGLRAGRGAFLGTLFGKVVKIAVGAIQVIMLLAQIFGVLTF